MHGLSWPLLVLLAGHNPNFQNPLFKCWTDPCDAARMYALLLPELDKRQTRLVIHVSKKLARVLACSAVCIQMAPTTTFTSPNIIHASLVTITLCSKRSDLHLDVVSISEKQVLNLNRQEALSYDVDCGRMRPTTTDEDYVKVNMASNSDI